MFFLSVLIRINLMIFGYPICSGILSSKTPWSSGDLVRGSRDSLRVLAETRLVAPERHCVVELGLGLPMIKFHASKAVPGLRCSSNSKNLIQFCWKKTPKGPTYQFLEKRNQKQKIKMVPYGFKKSKSFQLSE
jgi:hypothetical protein